MEEPIDLPNETKSNAGSGGRLYVSWLRTPQGGILGWQGLEINFKSIKRRVSSFGKARI